MPYKITIFTKILILITSLLIPLLMVYGLSNRITNQVIRKQIESSNLNQLSFLAKQLDAQIEQLSMFPVILSSDPYVREFIDHNEASMSERLKAQSRLKDKLSLQSVSSGWTNDLAIMLPKEETVVASSIFYDPKTALSKEDRIRKTWFYSAPAGGPEKRGEFVREISEPARAESVAQATALFQVKFSAQNVIDMLDGYKQDKQSNPFLYHPGYEPIMSSRSSFQSAINAILQALQQELPSESGQRIVMVDNQPYMVSYVLSAQLGWHIVDFVPLQNILLPINQIRNLFYVTVGLLLLIGILASFLLYNQVQKPLLALMRNVQRLKNGDFSARIRYRAKNEFDFLIDRFNEMAQQIQVLIEDVYAERIRSRDATLKQLQSQINPHFLYNSLFFIINSSIMRDHEAVEAMAQNLADYCRYTTRTEDQSVSLREELEMVRSYLIIQNLRMDRLSYEIRVPESMQDERVPRLILQPIVENAIIHGIEHRLEGGMIVISGEQDENQNRLVVEDNGGGLTEQELYQLRNRLQQPMSKEIGCGTWNVHHRLYYQFGEGSGLDFMPAPGGGLKAVLTWNRHEAACRDHEREGE